MNRWHCWMLCFGCFSGMAFAAPIRSELSDLLQDADPLVGQGSLSTNRFDGGVPMLSADRGSGSGYDPAGGSSSKPGASNPLVQSQWLVERSWRPELQRFIRQRDWKEALASAQRALLQRPDDVPLLKEAALLSVLAKQPLLANTYFASYLEQRPQDRVMRMAYLTHLLQTDRSAEAARWLRDLIEETPADLRVRYLAALLSVFEPDIDLGDHSSTAWKRISTTELTRVAGWVVTEHEALEAVFGSSKLEQVRSLLVGSASLSDLELLHQSLVDAERAAAAKKWDTALILFQQTQRYGTEHFEVRQRQAEMLFRTGRKQEALQVMSQLVMEAPAVANYWYNHGLLLLQEPRYQEASVSLSKAFRLDPTHGPSAFGLACAYAGMGRQDEAWEIMSLLQRNFRDQLLTWTSGEAVFLEPLRKDPRYFDMIKGLRADP